MLDWLTTMYEFLYELLIMAMVTKLDWPYCNAARQLSSVIMSTKDFSQWDQLKYRRRIETFGVDDGPGTTDSSKTTACADYLQSSRRAPKTSLMLFVNLESLPTRVAKPP